MEFVPDPDFLKKINQNMQNNARHFNEMGQIRGKGGQVNAESPNKINIEMIWNKIEIAQGLLLQTGAS